MQNRKLRGVSSAALLCTLVSVGGMAACATNPVTGKRELSLVSESQEISMGAQAAEETKQSIGVTPDQALQSYVTSLGMSIARASERPGLPWSYTVVEDPSVNAFALPGGPVFVTRGILAHMNSEAQLVSVIGHETGHITAKHSVHQISTSQLSQIALVGAVIAKPELAQFGDLASQGLGLLFLKFSRDDETQADELGFKYMTAQGYDPHEMATMFHTLERIDNGGGGKTPQWMSTHPDPGNRVQKTNDRIKAAGASAAGTKVNRDAFLQRLEGLVFGENPRDGFFRGTHFLHPTLKFEFDFPSGWKTQNTSAQVAGVSSAEDAIVVLTTAGTTAPAQALQTFMTQTGMQSRGSSNANVNGLSAATGSFSFTQEQTQISGWVTFVSLDGATFRLLGYTTPDKFNSYDGTLHNAVNSLRRLTDPSALNVQPVRVHLVRITSPMTMDQFNQKYPSTIKLDQLSLINGLEGNATIPAGTLVKRVN